MGNAPAYLVGAGVIVGAAGFGIWKVRRWIERQPWLVSLWHFLSGWRRDGRGGRARRAGIRCGVTAGAVALVAAWAAAPVLTSRFAIFVVIAGVGWAAWLSWRWVRSFKHRR